MGSSTSTTSQSSQSSPWAAAQPEVSGLLGQLGSLIPNSGTTSAQTGAINQLTANGQAGDQFAPAVSSTATNLLNGGGATSQNPTLQSNLNNYDAGMSTYTNPNYSTINSQPVQAALQQVATDTGDQINSQFAAAGRSGSGMNQQTLARGVAAAEAPIILNQANTDTATRENALNGVYGAGNTTSGAITNNNQTANTNAENGITASNNALQAENWGPQSVIAAQELGQQIPAQNLGMLAQIGIPLAQLGTNSTGTSQTVAQPSLLQEITGLGGMIGSGASTSASGATSGGSGILGLLGAL